MTCMMRWVANRQDIAGCEMNMDLMRLIDKFYPDPQERDEILMMIQRSADKQREQIRERVRRYRLNHREHSNERSRKYRSDNRGDKT